MEANLLTWAMVGILALIMGTVLAVLTAWPVMLLWNAFVPSIFGLNAITFTEALGISLLSSLLFKSTPSSSK